MKDIWSRRVSRGSLIEACESWAQGDVYICLIMSRLVYSIQELGLRRPKQELSMTSGTK